MIENKFVSKYSIKVCVITFIDNQQYIIQQDNTSNISIFVIDEYGTYIDGEFYGNNYGRLSTFEEEVYKKIIPLFKTPEAVKNVELLLNDKHYRFNNSQIMLIGVIC